MTKTVIVIAAVAVLSSALLAEEHFGVKVYPNVKTDASTAWYCKQFAPESARQAKQVAKASIATSAYCYRTADDFAAVAAFYQKHAGLEALGKITNTPSNKTARVLPGGNAVCGAGQRRGRDGHFSVGRRAEEANRRPHHNPRKPEITHEDTRLC